MYVITATATIGNNQIFDNEVADGMGGGLFLLFSDSTVRSNEIYSNTASYGGGLGLENGGDLHSFGATISDNLVTGNEASKSGGGISTLFNPLRVFIPLGLAFFTLGTVKFIIDMFYWNLSETAVFSFLAAIMIWSLGLIADMISRLHLRP